jgi:hypothetical protein
MPTFNWTGKTRDGLSKKGVIISEDVDRAMATLRAQAITPTVVKLKPKDLSEIFPILQPKPDRDLVMFTRQFATMIDGAAGPVPDIWARGERGVQEDHPADQVGRGERLDVLRRARQAR